MKNELTVFSNGAGQDSFDILLRFIHYPEFRQRYAPGHLIIVGSDVGAEKKETYANVERMRKLARHHNLEFYWVTPDMGFHSRTWPTLYYQYELNNSIGSAAFKQSCTDNLKIKVVDRFVENWLNKQMGTNLSRKKAYYEWHARTGNKIRLVIGFADEENRHSYEVAEDPIWKKKTIMREFPLVDLKINRQRAQEHTKQLGYSVSPPSNCEICFYQSLQELLYLWRTRPNVFIKWCKLERNKLQRDADKEKNYGVYGKKTLVQKLKMAIKKYGHMTTAELEEYSMSHGHCVKNRF